MLRGAWLALKPHIVGERETKKRMTSIVHNYNPSVGIHFPPDNKADWTLRTRSFNIFCSFHTGFSRTDPLMGRPILEIQRPLPEWVFSTRSPRPTAKHSWISTHMTALKAAPAPASVYRRGVTRDPFDVVETVWSKNLQTVNAHGGRKG